MMTLSENATTVFVVDDDPSVRDSLVFLLDSVGLGVETYETAEDFLEAHDDTRGGCLLLDVRMPGMSGLELQRRMAQRGNTLPIIVISGHGDVRTAVTAMQEGALDFVEKPFNENDLLERVQSALAHDRQRRDRYRERDAILERMRQLTDRELEVLDHVVQGEPTKAIASELGTSFNTVQNQRASILRKMQARSVADLVRMVMIARGYDTAVEED